MESKSTGKKTWTNKSVPYQKLPESSDDDSKKEREGTSESKRAKVLSGNSPFVGPRRSVVSRTTTNYTRGQSVSPTLRRTSLRQIPLQLSKASSDGEKNVKIAPGTRGREIGTFTKNTPRRTVSQNNRVNTLQVSDSRAKDKEWLLEELRKADSLLHTQVLSAGMQAGKEERGLPDVLESTLATQSDWFTPTQLTQAKSGIENIKQQLAQAGEIERDLFVQVGELVCEAVARELASELVKLGVDLNANVLVDHAEKIQVEDPMPLDLQGDLGNGLFILAQHIGERVGKQFAATDPTLDSLKKAVEFKKEGEKKESDEGQIDPLTVASGQDQILVRLVAKAYIRIAQRVAITVAQSLMGKVQKFEPAITNKMERSKSLRPTKFRLRKRPRRGPLHVLLQPVPPTDLPSHSSIQAADPQSPSTTDQPNDEVIITSPPKPEVSANNDT